MTPAARISRTLAQPPIYVSRKGVAVTAAQIMARVSRLPKPVTLVKPMPERRAT
jgi:hypothetical protein